MAKITLEVPTKELDRVLTILQSIKPELIEHIEVEKKQRYNTPKPLPKEPLKPVSINSKYVDPQTFKERLRRKKNGK